MGSAGPPEALDIFLASDLPPEELAALRAEADPDGGALTDLEFQIKEIYSHTNDPVGYPAVLTAPKDPD